MTRISLCAAALALLALPSAAATYRSAAYQAVTESVSVPLQSRSGAARPAQQVFVTVTRLDGAALSRGELPAAQGFAAQVACGGGTMLGTLAAGLDGAAAQFEVLCVEG